MSNLCRCCGKPVPKRTITTWFEPERTQYHQPNRYTRYIYFGIEGRPRTKADAQRYINDGVIVSVDRGEGGIRKVGVWDRTSYQDPFFCTGTCAQSFARTMAKLGHHTVAHERAVDRAKAKELAHGAA